MTLSNEKDYAITKKIKRNLETINQQYKELASWIEKEYSVIVVNIKQDYVLIAYEKQPRLSIVLERTKDYMTFEESPFCYDKIKQANILHEYKKSIEYQKLKNKEKLLVVFENFEKVYFEEIINKLSKDDLKELREVLGMDQIWIIENKLNALYVFFFTEDSRKKCANNRIEIVLKEKYFNLLQKYDEFRYVMPENLKIVFDSKENFDSNYQSSWFNYYR